MINRRTTEESLQLGAANKRLLARTELKARLRGIYSLVPKDGRQQLRRPTHDVHDGLSVNPNLELAVLLADIVQLDALRDSGPYFVKDNIC